MRKILFKAKAINREKGYHRTNYKNGDWVCGLITRLYDERFENLPAEMTDENGVSGIEIDHNTICQYTGLTDKNGNKIWESDVVRVEWNDNGEEAEEIQTVSWGKHGWYPWLDEYSCDGCDLYSKISFVEVIGTKFDNPELLGG